MADGLSKLKPVVLIYCEAKAYFVFYPLKEKKVEWK